MIVGIIGKAQSGKDTFAKVLVDEGGFVRMAFADELKRDVADFLGITVMELEERKGEFRSTLQEYGSRMRRELRASYCWINRIEPALTVLLNAGKSVVITDVRYQNEADWIRALGGIIIRRVRSDGVGLVGEQAQHSSETELDDIRVDMLCTCTTVEAIQGHASRFLTIGVHSDAC